MAQDNGANGPATSPS